MSRLLTICLVTTSSVLVTLLAACGPRAPVEPALTNDDPEAGPPLFQSPALTVEATSTPDPTANWKHYSDEVLGLSFRYPPSWFLYPSPVEGHGATTLITSFDLEDAPPLQAPVSPGHARIGLSLSEFDFSRVGFNEEWVRDYMVPPDAQIIDVGRIVIGGREAISTRYRHAGASLFTAFLLRQDGLYVFYAESDEDFPVDVIDTILSTVEFLLD